MRDFLAGYLEHKPRIDAALSVLDKRRLRLPLFNVAKYFKDFDLNPVEFYEVPIGAWSSPIADVLFLAKVIVCSRPKRLLEIGSFRGYTALAMARHMPQESKLVTLDRDERHGEAYLQSDLRNRIERRVGSVGADIFSSDVDGSYDLIFLDAGHRFEEVKADTAVLMRLLSPNGFFLWHDYSNWGRWNKFNGVPEYLHEFSKNHRVARIDGSGMAIHSPFWNTPQGELKFNEAISCPMSEETADPWVAQGVR